jgi:hypothetical protein
LVIPAFGGHAEPRLDFEEATSKSADAVPIARREGGTEETGRLERIAEVLLADWHGSGFLRGAPSGG